MSQSPLIIVTVPHAYCGPDAPATHACDPAAPPAAAIITRTFSQLGYPTLQLNGHTDRRILDLNRRVAAGNSFHARARAAIRRSRTGAVLIDTHSYPANQFPDIRHWASYDVVLCAYPFNHAASTAVANRLNQSGVRSAVETPFHLPVLRRYWTIQSLGPLCRLAVMPEFNEDAHRTRTTAPAELAHAVHHHLTTPSPFLP